MGSPAITSMYNKHTKEIMYVFLSFNYAILSAL